MFCIAVLFDAVGWIPLVNLLTEVLAGLIIGWWQKGYTQRTDPLFTFVIAKILDAAFLGFLPSNIGIVIYAYIKKKTAAAAQTPMGRYAAQKITNS